MTQEPITQILVHHGVKGMKWGVRRDKGHEGERAKTKQIGKLDQKFAANRGSVKTTFAIYNAAADKTNKVDIARINNKPQYKGQDFSRDTPLRRKYYAEHQKAFLDNLHQAADEMGTNASGTKKYGIFESPNGGWDVTLADVQHAADNVAFRVKVNKNETGHIVSITVQNPELQMSDMETDELVLLHYGVPGMKWGRRKARGGVTTSQKTPPHEDHTTARELKKKGPKALSNSELKALNNRLQLEKSYSDLTKNQDVISKGHNKAKTILAFGATASTAYALATSPMAKSIASAISKK